MQVNAQDGIDLRAWLFRPDRFQWRCRFDPARDRRFARQPSGVGPDVSLRTDTSVLVPDSRAHGESGGDLATYGLLESDDVHRWVSWLMEEEHPLRVFGLGESLGGAVLIQSLSVEHASMPLLPTAHTPASNESRRIEWPKGFHFRPRLAEFLRNLPSGLASSMPVGSTVWTFARRRRKRPSLDPRRPSCSSMGFMTA